MEPNQSQPQRGDYQSVPAERPQTYAGSLAVEQSSETPLVPLATPPEATPPVAVPIASESVPTAVPPAPEAGPALQSQPLPATPPAAPAPPVMPFAPAMPPQSSTPQPVAADVPARPWQQPHDAADKPRPWKTQKFWLLAVSGFFVLLLLIGLIIGYKATHHRADNTLPRAAVTSVDTSSDIKTIGSTPADQAANKQRQQSILSLRSYIEAYYTANNRYPTTANMTDAAWVSSNLKGVTADLLTDPSGTTASLAGQPGKGRYAYQAGADSNLGTCDNDQINCNFYQLTAILSDGSKYTKTALQ